ncbi:MAG TPA: AIPR family protein, partial [Pirellulales bacterium]|nr:AIPR family protein [Pirellulales bacterium]
PKVDADLYLSNWGQIKDPYPAVFGRVQGQAIAELWKKHPHLAHMNLRDYSRRSDVNQAIARTAKEEPHHFWYFNNGLTIICDSIEPAIYGRLQQDVALFRFEGISLVNGAQTTGIVADNFDMIAEAERANLWIQLRAIAVKHCPDNFPKSVTKYTNLQNAIGVQDFVGLDPLHSRIATDFALEKRRYVFRWGEDEPTGDKGCSLREVTFALACANPDPWFAVQAKREISQLWLTDSARYRELFHPDLNVTKIWNAVKILRAVDRVVASHESDPTPRADLVSNHLQRIVLHLVFQDPGLVGWDTAKDDSILAKVKGVANRVFGAVQIDTDIFHKNEYLASVSKNYEKCRLLVDRVRKPPEEQKAAWLPGFEATKL